MNLRVRVAELLRTPGERKEISRTVVAHEMSVVDSSVPEGSTLTFEGALDSLGDSIALTGQVSYEWKSACRRCLEAVSGHETVDVREVYGDLDDDDMFPLDGDEIDLEPVIREAVLLELPVAPLCRDECRGPEPERYPAEPMVDPDPDAEAPIDPRWAALDDLDLS